MGGFATERAFDGMGSLWNRLTMTAPTVLASGLVVQPEPRGYEPPAVGAMVRETIAYMRRANNMQDSTFATSIRTAPVWACYPARNTVGAWLRLCIAFAAVNRVQVFHTRDAAGTAATDPHMLVVNELVYGVAPRVRRTADLSIASLINANLAAGYSATYAFGGWLAQWVSNLYTAQRGVPRVIRSDARGEINAVYNVGVTELGLIGAAAAVDYLDALRKYKPAEDTRVGIPMPNDPDGPRAKDPQKWFQRVLLDTYWKPIPLLGKIAILAVGGGVLVGAAAPYARTAAAASSKAAGAYKQWRGSSPSSSSSRQQRRRARKRVRRGT